VKRDVTAKSNVRVELSSHYRQPFENANFSTDPLPLQRIASVLINAWMMMRAPADCDLFAKSIKATMCGRFTLRIAFEKWRTLVLLWACRIKRARDRPRA
jgi:hypothetical protein